MLQKIQQRDLRNKEKKIQYKDFLKIRREGGTRKKDICIERGTKSEGTHSRIQKEGQDIQDLEGGRKLEIQEEGYKLKESGTGSFLEKGRKN